MLHAFDIVIIISMMAVVTVLMSGLTNMVTQGERGAMRSNQLMVARCLFQAITIGLLFVGALFAL